MFRLDDLSKKIIAHLSEGRKSFKKISDELGVSENTIKTRIRKLEENGVLQISGYVDPEAMAGHIIAYIGVKIKGMEYTAKGEELSRLHRVVSVAVVTGRYDVILTVHLKQDFDLLHFLKEELGKVSGIESIETFMAYKGFNIKVPFITEEKIWRKMNRKFPELGVHVPRILIPGKETNHQKWAVIACDQFSSEKEYWERARTSVGKEPSTLNLIVPECYLGEKDEEQRVKAAHKAMKDTLKNEILTELSAGFILVNRSTPHAVSREGLVLAVDLEAYDFSEDSTALIRPTEGTILNRLPPRMAVRRGAELDLPHILLLIDDAENRIMRAAAAAADNQMLYDFDLMEGGGHVTGRFVPAKNLGGVEKAFEALSGSSSPLFAVGDGNHSLASARQIWLENKAAGCASDHPSRFVLVEVENIHDPGVAFHPIHRVLFGVNPQEAAAELQGKLGAQGSGEASKASKAPPNENIRVVLPKEPGRSWTYPVPEGRLMVEPLQKELDAWIESHPGSRLDYIHGEETVKTLVEEQPDRLGIILPPIDKNVFFRRIRDIGPYPRKTFSIGEAVEKRYYMESRRLS